MEYLATLHPIHDLGRGAFGLVRLCKDDVHGLVAAKYFFRSTFPDPGDWLVTCDKALAEAQALKHLEHRNVVRVHHVLRSPQQDEFLLVMEFCDGGSARALSESNVINLLNVKKIIRDAAIGLNYIHNQKFLHRDIKPDNILLTSHNEVKIGDFGFVTDKLAAGFATPYGTPCYLAPEVPVNLTCSALSDVYSLGVTFIHLMHGDHWFLRQGRGQMLDWDEPFPPLASRGVWLPHIPAFWRTFVGRLTHADPAKRCQSMDEAVNLIARLPVVENWTCQVEADQISWILQPTPGSRKVRVLWENYLRRGESWCAWSEDAHGKAKKTLFRSQKGAPWMKTYRGLQEFFRSRHKRLS